MSSSPVAAGKILIIIRGRNLYPQDIEQTVEEVDPAGLRPGCNAAFSVETASEERLVMVQEVQRRFHDESSEWRSRPLAEPRARGLRARAHPCPSVRHDD